ncbi:MULTISPECIES: hypothetical protein [unclassified Streptomyces]|uniref:hypothetical protein n=1 Tax=unclassified Streptomyces TaxID=2593676 RepID=UPI000CD5716D|nr:MULTISPECIES: hypothetical protein [unclassified Streptomyces]
MARGRHRYIPPRRLLIPAGVGGCAVLTAGAALLTADGLGLVPALLIVATAGAGVAGAVLMRQRESAAEGRVARERAARAAGSVETDALRDQLEEATDRATALEHRLQGKRIDLARLRGEHAELLRRYALAENGRANALEGRRRIALEAGRPARALPAGATDHRTASGSPTSLTYLQAFDALRNLARNADRQRRQAQEAAAAVASPPAPQQQPQPQPQRPPTHWVPPNRGGFDYFGTAGDDDTEPGAPGGHGSPTGPSASLTHPRG